jgi:hypothetical protein
MTITELLVSFVVSGALFFSLGYGTRLLAESNRKFKERQEKQRQKRKNNFLSGSTLKCGFRAPN